MNPIMDDDPVSDIARLTEIGRLDLYSAEIRSELDRYASTCAQRLGLPLGMISIVLDGAQYFAGSHGVDGWMAESEGTYSEWSFCANVVRNRSAYVVEDATTDALQHDNPLVTEDGLVCYAGAPLLTSSGHVLGACCVGGAEARSFSSEEVGYLQEMADQIVVLLEQQPPLT